MTMRKNGQQQTLHNRRAAGRPKLLTQKERASCIYHRSRPLIPKDKPVHVTVKFNKSKIRTLRNKKYYQEIRKSFRRLRIQGARLIEFSIQQDHIHLLLETSDSKTLGRAMRALSISLSKRFTLLINHKIKALKNRYHLHILNTLNELKNARNYILNNGKKHLVPDMDDLYFSRADFTLFRPTEALLEFLDDLKSVLDTPQFWMTRKF
jgi:REP element-mobilizing transposase RayT